MRCVHQSGGLSSTARTYSGIFINACSKRAGEVRFDNREMDALRCPLVVSVALVDETRSIDGKIELTRGEYHDPR